MASGEGLYVSSDDRRLYRIDLHHEAFLVTDSWRQSAGVLERASDIIFVETDKAGPHASIPFDLEVTSLAPGAYLLVVHGDRGTRSATVFVAR